MAVDVLGLLFLIIWLTLAICLLWVSDIDTCWLSGRVHVLGIKETVGFQVAQLSNVGHLSPNRPFLLPQIVAPAVFPRISCCYYPLLQ